MTKEEIIELQEVTSRDRMLFWRLLMKGQFNDDEHAKAIFTCYFTLDKVADLVKRYITQLPLEAPAPPIKEATLLEVELSQAETPLTDSLWPPEPEPNSRKKVKP
jgi:hypothetical protein